MSTSMLDALAAEAAAVTELGIEASRLGVEALRRANALQAQLAHLAAEERQKASTEFRDTPGNMPAAQESGAGKTGSDVVALGGAATRVSAESEQAVAESVTGERGFEPRKDPVTAPDGTAPVPLCELNLGGWRATHQDQTIQFARHEFRLIVALNDQRVHHFQQILDRCMWSGIKKLRREVSRLNPRIALIGIEIHEPSPKFFVLRQRPEA